VKKIFGKRNLLLLLIVIIVFVLIGEKLYCFSVKDFGYSVLVRSREAIAGLFVFGDYDKANWNIIIAKKRLKEAEKEVSLKCQKKNFNLLTTSISRMDKFYDYYKISKNNGEDVNYFIPESADYFTRIKKFESFFDAKYLDRFNNKFLLIKEIEKNLINK
jgi:hypothetical protein